MKHLSGDRTGSKTEPLKNSFILFFFLFPSLAFAQIPINGFCSLESYSIPKGYQEVISADLNSNGNEELIFYSAHLKRIGIFSGISDDLSEFNEFEINAEISLLRRLNDKEKGNSLFAAVERKQRRVSIIYISVDSIDTKKTHIEFDSYPENIFSADVNLDGLEEILVSGSGFDGLSILFRANGSIGESKIVSGTSFSEAVFADLNNDGYPDVLAFNILENSLQFFINNTNGKFRYSRSIPYPDKIDLLHAIDLNRDGLPDIIYSIGNNLEILPGDFRSSHKEKKTIKLNDKPMSITFGDFNKDRLPDISYLMTGGSVHVLFGKSNSDFYESVSYMKVNSPAAIHKFKAAGSDNLICVNESDEIAVIKSVDKINGSMRLVPAIQANAVKMFNYGNDNIPDISFVDEYDNYLKILLNDEAGIPSALYYLPLAENHNEFVIDEFFHYIKTFYCYAEGSPLFEVFKYNFKTNKASRKQLYAPGEILDLVIQRVDSSLVNIFIVYNKQSRLHLGKFENRNVSITFKEYPMIDRNVSLAKILIKDEPEVYYWKTERDTFHFILADIEPGPNIIKEYFSIPESDGLRINLFAADQYYSEYPSVVSLVQNESENRILTISGDRFSNTSDNFRAKAGNNRQFSRGFFGETSIKGIINFTVFTADDNYINKMIFKEKEKKYSLSRMLAAEDVSDYFFARLDKKNYYLIYSNKEGSLFVTPIK